MRAACLRASDYYGPGVTQAALGEVWFAPHAPAVTQREMVERAAALAGVDTPRIISLPPWMLRVAGFFTPSAKATIEMLYQFTAPFFIETRKLEYAFGITPTPVEEGLARTVAWYQQRA